MTRSPTEASPTSVHGHPSPQPLEFVQFTTKFQVRDGKTHYLMLRTAPGAHLQRSAAIPLVFGIARSRGGYYQPKTSGRFANFPAHTQVFDILNAPDARLNGLWGEKAGYAKGHWAIVDLVGKGEHIRGTGSSNHKHPVSLNLLHSDLASMRMGMSASASFQSARKL